MMYRIFLFVLALFLTACANLGGEDRYWLKSGQGFVDDPQALLYYAQYVRDLGAAEREREVSRQQSAFVRDKSAFRRVQYTLVLLSGPPGTQDRRLLHQLLEPVLEGNQSNGVAAIASLLDSHLQSLRRADELEKKLSAMREIERSLLQRERGRP